MSRGVLVALILLSTVIQAVAGFLEITEGRRLARKAAGSLADTYQREMTRGADVSALLQPSRRAEIAVVLVILGAVLGAVAAVGALFP